MNFFKSLTNLIAMNRTRNALSRLTDAQLKDIGLHRGQIEDRVRQVSMNNRA